MIELKRFKVQNDGATSYRQEGSTKSVKFPKGFFEGEAPEFVQLEAANVAAVTARASGGGRPVDPAIAQARQILADARAKRKEELAARIAAMTPDQKAKRDERLAKLKEKARAKKAQG